MEESDDEIAYRRHIVCSSDSSEENDLYASDESCDGKPPPQVFTKIIKIPAKRIPNDASSSDDEIENSFAYDSGKNIVNHIDKQTKNVNIQRKIIPYQKPKIVNNTDNQTKNVTMQRKITTSQKQKNVNNSQFSQALWGTSHQQKPNQITSKINSKQPVTNNLSVTRNGTLMQLSDFGILPRYFVGQNSGLMDAKANADLITISNVPQFGKPVTFINKKQVNKTKLECILQKNTSSTNNKTTFLSLDNILGPTIQNNMYSKAEPTTSVPSKPKTWSSLVSNTPSTSKLPAIIQNTVPIPKTIPDPIPKSVASSKPKITQAASSKSVEASKSTKNHPIVENDVRQFKMRDFLPPALLPDVEEYEDISEQRGFVETSSRKRRTRGGKSSRERRQRRRRKERIDSEQKSAFDWVEVEKLSSPLEKLKIDNEWRIENGMSSTNSYTNKTLNQPENLPVENSYPTILNREFNIELSQNEWPSLNQIENSSTYSKEKKVWNVDKLEKLSSNLDKLVTCHDWNIMNSYENSDVCQQATNDLNRSVLPENKDSTQWVNNEKKSPHEEIPKDSFLNQSEKKWTDVDVNIGNNRTTSLKGKIASILVETEKLSSQPDKRVDIESINTNMIVSQQSNDVNESGVPEINDLGKDNIEKNAKSKYDFMDLTTLLGHSFVTELAGKKWTNIDYNMGNNRTTSLKGKIPSSLVETEKLSSQPDKTVDMESIINVNKIVSQHTHDVNESGVPEINDVGKDNIEKKTKSKYDFMDHPTTLLEHSFVTELARKKWINIEDIIGKKKTTDLSCPNIKKESPKEDTSVSKDGHDKTTTNEPDSMDRPATILEDSVVVQLTEKEWANVKHIASKKTKNSEEEAAAGFVKVENPPSSLHKLKTELSLDIISENNLIDNTEIIHEVPKGASKKKKKKNKKKVANAIQLQTTIENTECKKYNEIVNKENVMKIMEKNRENTKESKITRGTQTNIEISDQFSDDFEVNIKPYEFEASTSHFQSFNEGLEAYDVIPDKLKPAMLVTAASIEHEKTFSLTETPLYDVSQTENLQLPQNNISTSVTSIQEVNSNSKEIDDITKCLPKKKKKKSKKKGTDSTVLQTTNINIIQPVSSTEIKTKEENEYKVDLNITETAITPNSNDGKSTLILEDKKSTKPVHKEDKFKTIVSKETTSAECEIEKPVSKLFEVEKKMENGVEHLENHPTDENVTSVKEEKGVSEELAGLSEVTKKKKRRRSKKKVASQLQNSNEENDEDPNAKLKESYIKVSNEIDFDLMDYVDACLRNFGPQCNLTNSANAINEVANSTPIQISEEKTLDITNVRDMIAFNEFMAVQMRKLRIQALNDLTERNIVLNRSNTHKDNNTTTDSNMLKNQCEPSKVDEENYVLKDNEMQKDESQKKKKRSKKKPDVTQLQTSAESLQADNNEEGNNKKEEETNITNDNADASLLRNLCQSSHTLTTSNEENIILKDGEPKNEVLKLKNKKSEKKPDTAQLHTINQNITANNSKGDENKEEMEAKITDDNADSNLSRNLCQSSHGFHTVDGENYVPKDIPKKKNKKRKNKLTGVQLQTINETIQAHNEVDVGNKEETETKITEESYKPTTENRIRDQTEMNIKISDKFNEMDTDSLDFESCNEDYVIPIQPTPNNNEPPVRELNHECMLIVGDKILTTSDFPELNKNVNVGKKTRKTSTSEETPTPGDLKINATPSQTKVKNEKILENSVSELTGIDCQHSSSLTSNKEFDEIPKELSKKKKKKNKKKLKNSIELQTINENINQLEGNEGIKDNKKNETSKDSSENLEEIKIGRDTETYFKGFDQFNEEFEINTSKYEIEADDTTDFVSCNEDYVISNESKPNITDHERMLIVGDKILTTSDFPDLNKHVNVGRKTKKTSTSEETPTHGELNINAIPSQLLELETNVENEKTLQNSVCESTGIDYQNSSNLTSNKELAEIPKEFLKKKKLKHSIELQTVNENINQLEDDEGIKDNEKNETSKDSSENFEETRIERDTETYFKEFAQFNKEFEINTSKYEIVADDTTDFESCNEDYVIPNESKPNITDHECMLILGDKILTTSDFPDLNKHVNVGKKTRKTSSEETPTHGELNKNAIPSQLLELETNVENEKTLQNSVSELTRNDCQNSNNLTSNRELDEIPKELSKKKKKKNKKKLKNFIELQTINENINQLKGNEGIKDNEKNETSTDSIKNLEEIKIERDTETYFKEFAQLNEEFENSTLKYELESDHTPDFESCNEDVETGHVNPIQSIPDMDETTVTELMDEKCMLITAKKILTTTDFPDLNRSALIRKKKKKTIVKSFLELGKVEKQAENSSSISRTNETVNIISLQNSYDTSNENMQLLHSKISVCELPDNKGQSVNSFTLINKQTDLEDLIEKTKGISESIKQEMVKNTTELQNSKGKIDLRCPSSVNEDYSSSDFLEMETKSKPNENVSPELLELASTSEGCNSKLDCTISPQSNDQMYSFSVEKGTSPKGRDEMEKNVAKKIRKKKNKQKDPNLKQLQSCNNIQNEKIKNIKKAIEVNTTDLKEFVLVDNMKKNKNKKQKFKNPTQLQHLKAKVTDQSDLDQYQCEATQITKKDSNHILSRIDPTSDDVDKNMLVLDGKILTAEDFPVLQVDFPRRLFESGKPYSAIIKEGSSDKVSISNKLEDKMKDVIQNINSNSQIVRETKSAPKSLKEKDKFMEYFKNTTTDNSYNSSIPPLSRTHYPGTHNFSLDFPKESIFRKNTLNDFFPDTSFLQQNRSEEQYHETTPTSTVIYVNECDVDGHHQRRPYYEPVRHFSVNEETGLLDGHDQQILPSYDDELLQISPSKNLRDTSTVINMEECHFDSQDQCQPYLMRSDVQNIWLDSMSSSYSASQSQSNFVTRTSTANASNSDNEEWDNQKWDVPDFTDDRFVHSFVGENSFSDDHESKSPSSYFTNMCNLI